MQTRFRRTEKRWLVSENDARALEYYLRREQRAQPDEYGVESVYIRVTKRSRIRLRRYLVAGDQEASRGYSLEEAEAITTALGLGPQAKSVALGNLLSNGVRGAGMADHLRSGGSFARFEASRLGRRVRRPSSSSGDEGESPEEGSGGAGPTEQEVFEESLVHGV